MLSGFMTGFLNEKSRQITTRKEQGRNYFEQQAGRAKKISTTQLETRRENTRKLLQTANTLVHTANMPKHIVRGLIGAGPEALSSAYSLYQEVPTHEWSANDWESIYETSQFYAQEYNEDLPTFIKRTTGLIGDNYRATEETGGDLQSAFVSSALGYNAKREARRGLNEMEVVPGFTASDLHAMESRPDWQSDLRSTYAGPNMGVVQGIMQQNQPVEPISDRDRLFFRNEHEKMINSNVDRLARQAYRDYRQSDQYQMDNAEARPMTLDDFKIDQGVIDLAEIEAAREFATTLNPETLAGLDFIQPHLVRLDDMMRQGQERMESQQLATEAVDAVQSSPMPQPTPEPEMPVSEAPVASQGGSRGRGARRGPFQAVSDWWTGRQESRQQENVQGREELGMEPPLTQEGIQQDLQRQQANPEGRVRERATDFPPQGWTPQDGGNLQTPDGRLVQPIGVDPTTLAWVYRDLTTGEEFTAE